MANLQQLPRLSRFEFFRYREDELAASLARAIADHVDRFPDAELTGHHAAISAWSAMAFNVPNGGFVQFFYNHRGELGVTELAALFDALDLSKAAVVIRDATAVYRQHRDKFEVSDPFDGLYGSIKAFDKLDRSFTNSMTRCSRAMDSWIRDHITELATDETGAPIDRKFSGRVEIHHPNGQVKESLEVKNGKPHGAYREYFEDGSIRDSVFYKAGQISGDFWPNGQMKRKESKRGEFRIIEWYYPSGSLQKRYVTGKDGHAAEPIRLFHENGQLAEEISTVKGKKLGPWLKFFDDGTPELEAEYVDEEKLVVRNAWNDKREQVVKQGNGIFFDDGRALDWKYDIYLQHFFQRECELKDGIPHGKVTHYFENVLSSIAQYVEGKCDGESTSFWENGRIRSVTKFVKGVEVESRKFPKFDRPVPAVVLYVEANEKLYSAWRHIRVDEYPLPLNLDEIRSQLQVPVFLQEVHERNLSGTSKSEYEDCNTFNDGIAYILTVDESGNVTAARANGSGMYSGGEWETYPPLLRQLRFSPGRLRGHAIECQVLARVDHTFIEEGPGREN